MSDDLLRAVFAAPDDDGPRRVYADWLEEHGERPRAELIHVQCELARASGPCRDELAARERQLLDEFASTWAEPLRDLVCAFVFTRGFIERVEMSVETAPERIGRVMELAPVRHIRCMDQMDDLSGLASALPALRPLIGLELWCLYAPDDAVAEKLVTAPELANLRTLILRHDRNGNLLGDDVAVAAVGAPHRANLEHLAINVDASWRGPSDRVAEVIASSPHLGRLRVLDLSNVRWERATVQAMAPRIGQLTHLDLGGADLPHAGWLDLASGLRERGAKGRLQWLRLHGAKVRERFGTPGVRLEADPLTEELREWLGADVVDLTTIDLFYGDQSAVPERIQPWPCRGFGS